MRGRQQVEVQQVEPSNDDDQLPLIENVRKVAELVGRAGVAACRLIIIALEDRVEQAAEKIAGVTQSDADQQWADAKVERQTIENELAEQLAAGEISQRAFDRARKAARRAYQDAWRQYQADCKGCWMHGSQYWNRHVRWAAQ